MLKDWNTMENANLEEKKLLKRVDELDDAVYLYDPLAYLERTFIVKTDYGKELQFKDTDICKAREYFKDKTYKYVNIQSGETMALETPNISRFYFNVYPTSKKSYEIKVETIDTRHWVNRIHYKTYVLPAFKSEIEPYYTNVKNLPQIAESVYSKLKYKFKNPNEYEICNYLIKSKDSHEDKLKMLDKIQYLPIYNYNVIDVRYSKYGDELVVRIDDIKIDLNSNIDVLDETVRLLDLQECRHCKCDNCKYYNCGTCIKNAQVLRNNTPCSLYTPNKQYKIFEKEWNKASTEAKQGYLDFIGKYVDNGRTIISKEDNVTYFTEGTVFNRKPNEIVKAEYKQTYYPRRKKNRIVIEEL